MTTEPFLICGEIPSIKERYFFIDADFLNVIFNDEAALRSFLTIFPGSYFMIDPLTKFEFLRGVYLPAQKALKEQFISNKDVFLPAENHPAFFQKIQESALFLSNIYAHQKAEGPSSVDLLLAGRAMNSRKALVLTGNRKDFPACAFKTVTILNYEKSGSNNIQAFPLLEFDKATFDRVVADLNKLAKKVGV